MCSCSVVQESMWWNGSQICDRFLGGHSRSGALGSHDGSGDSGGPGGSGDSVGW